MATQPYIGRDKDDSSTSTVPYCEYISKFLEYLLFMSASVGDIMCEIGTMYKLKPF